MKIDQIYIHQLYDTSNYDYDIAVARLTKRVEITDEIRPACIADKHDTVIPGTICHIAGWGYQKEGIPGPPELRKASVRLFHLMVYQSFHVKVT